MAVFTPVFVAACSSDAPDTTGTGSTTLGDSGTDPASSDTTVAEASDTTDADGATAGDGQALRWAQVELGFVSAYVMARGNTAAIYDTGVAGSADAIGRSLTDLGLTYNDVAHVVLSHHHGDHAGSIQEVMGRAVNATVYAGEADVDSIDVDTISPLVGGEDVFGFEALHTPGHTDGHMAVIDHDVGLLIAGDAIFTENGVAIEGPERFFSDVSRSQDSIRRMAALSYNTLLVGHGPPIETGAAAAVAALADSLG